MIISRSIGLSSYNLEFQYYIAILLIVYNDTHLKNTVNFINFYNWCTSTRAPENMKEKQREKRKNLLFTMIPNVICSH